MECNSQFDIVIAEPHGFCSGVKNAIRIAEQALEAGSGPIYCLHELVHNRAVVEKLAAKGMKFVSSIEEVPEGEAVLFSAHGVSPEVRKTAKGRSLKIIDATCIFVQKLHEAALSYANEGKTVLLVGSAGHDEVEGVQGEAPESIKVISTPDAVLSVAVPDEANIAILSQTTIARHQVDAIAEVVKKRFPQVVMPSKIGVCFATTERQEAVRQLAGKVEFVIVLGSKSSANSNRLVDVAHEVGLESVLLSDVNEVVEFFNKGALKGYRRIGITAGASTPEEVIDDVVKYLKSL